MSIEHRNALPQGYQLDEYVIDRILGAGGFGITYLAHERTLNRNVAIKEFLPRDLAVRGEDGSTIHPISSTDEEDFSYGLQRFREEARTLVNFRHPNIIPVHRLMEANGTAYLVMEYEDGDSLQEIVEREGTLDEERIRGILLPILDGLQQVHEAGFLHRDIKPGNIYIRHDGSPVLIDFGAARQALGAKSQSMTAVVSVGYAPMEQYSVRGKHTTATDIYALGATAYRAIAGTRPADAVERVESDPLIPAASAGKGRYSDAFLDAIDWALRMDASARPQSISEWRAALLGEASVPTIVRTADVAPTRAGQVTREDEAITDPAHQRRPMVVADDGDRTAPPKRSGGGSKALPFVALGLVVLIVASAAGAGWLWYEAREDARSAAKARVEVERQIAAEREKQRQIEERRKAAERARQEQLRRQGNGNYGLTIINKCNRVDAVYVAYRTREDSNRWVTRGWIRVARGGRSYSRLPTSNRIIYLYARGGGLQWGAQGQSGAIRRWVRQDNFVHSTGSLSGAGARLVWFHKKTIEPNTTGYEWTLICTN